MNFVLTALLITMSSIGHAELFCAARINKNGVSTGDKILEVSQRDEKAFLETQVSGYDIKVTELASKDQASPTLGLIVKNNSGIILETMMPSPGEQSGEAFVLTILNVEEGIMKIKCVKH